MVEASNSGDGDSEVSTEIARCPKCDADLEVGNLFCVECGSRIDD